MVWFVCIMRVILRGGDRALGAPGVCVPLHIGVGTGDPLTDIFFCLVGLKQSASSFLWFCLCVADDCTV
jgi:hypothetical protein